MIQEICGDPDYKPSTQYSWTGRFKIDSDGFAIEIPKPGNHHNLPTQPNELLQRQLYQWFTGVRQPNWPDQLWIRDDPEDANPFSDKPHDRYGEGYDPVLLSMRWIRTGWNKNSTGRWEFNKFNLD